ncbi:uncharacterized protein LOC143883314 [Tasmannia lanceolata]|uniref:uncharacterized protein LOC143883314 n=1 Tax=Tasmannia lanceolata TaxID=3420 RepID=UPI0040630804
MTMEEPVQHSMADKERHISVDPLSLTQSKKKDELGCQTQIPSTTTSNDAPPPLIPPKAKFISSSLPSSATSSPRSGLFLMKNLKKWRNQNQTSPLPVNSLSRQHSAALSRLVLPFQQLNLRRSKSCGEGRSLPPCDEFELSLREINYLQSKGNGNDLYYEHNNGKKSDHKDDNFKCGALCLFLPGFSGKGKQVRAKRDQSEDGNAISRTVSLEKFECGSWSSSAIVNGDEGNESMKRYFDLPLELIRFSANDANSPVTSAFVFDSDRKGVLKKNPSRKSHESTRHVRFSESPPTSVPSSPSSFCISPRLRKARDEFNVYLQEAQRA